MAIKHYIIALNVDKAIFHVFLWWMPLPQRFLSSKTVLIDQSTSPPLDAIGRFMLNLLNLNLQSSCKIANGDSYFNFFTPKSLNLKTKKNNEY